MDRKRNREFEKGHLSKKNDLSFGNTEFEIELSSQQDGYEGGQG